MTKLTVKELKAQAKAAGIRGNSGMRKAELESALSGRRSESVESRDANQGEKTAEELQRVVEEGTVELENPSVEVEDASVSETPETESSDAEKMERIVVEALKTETAETKREEMLRSIEDAGLIVAISEELYGSDYVKELLIKEICGKKGGRESESGDQRAASRPVNAEEFKKAFEELERGKIFVNIPELRRKLGWSHEEFDDMLIELRDRREIELHVTDLTIFEAEEFFYDEDDNSRMGMLTWKKSA